MGLIKLFISYRILKRHKADIEKYSKMTANEIYSLNGEDFCTAIETLVSAEAYKDPTANEAQITFAVVDNFHFEIMNGGLCEFFANSGRGCAPFVARSLDKIGAYKTKELFEDFVNSNNIDLNNLDSFATKDHDEYVELSNRYPFREFDEVYCEIDEVYDLLMEYARANVRDLTER